MNPCISLAHFLKKGVVGDICYTVFFNVCETNFFFFEGEGREGGGLG